LTLRYTGVRLSGSCGAFNFGNTLTAVVYVNHVTSKLHSANFSLEKI